MLMHLFIYFWLCWVLIIAHRLLSDCGVWVLKCMGYAVVANGLSSPATGGILVSRPGTEPTSPALEGGLLTTGPSGKFHLFMFLHFHLSCDDQFELGALSS